MKVILLQHVKGLGQKGDVKEVNAGYFQNFLKRQNLAREATESSVKHVNAQKAKSVEKLQNLKESAQAVQALIEGKEVTIAEKVSDSGTLYAAVSAKEVAEAIQTQLKASIPVKQLHVPDHIKEIGSYEVHVDLHKEVTAKFTLNVIAQ